MAKTNTDQPSKLITVRVTGQRIAEDGVGYDKGEKFDTTPERAEALGGFVEIISAD